MLDECEVETVKALHFSLEHLTAAGLKTRDIENAIFHFEMLDEKRYREARSRQEERA